MRWSQKISKRWQAFAKDRRPPDWLRRLFDRLDAAEVRIVRRQMSSMQRGPVFNLAMIMNLLGDGWLYGPLIGVILWHYGWGALRAVLVGGLSTGIAHILYPVIKTYIARQRPMYREPALITMPPPRDRYSCPSGHCMTATAAFIPFIYAYPTAWIGLALIWIGLAWARVAAAYHYPTDLVAGATFGGLIASFVSAQLLS